MRWVRHGGILIGGSFFLCEVFAGALRYYTFSAGTPWVGYAPRLILVLGVLCLVGSQVVRGRMSIPVIVGIFLLGLGVTTGSIFVKTFNQIAFGAWVSVPWLYGLATYDYFLSRISVSKGIRSFLLVLWASAVIGIAGNVWVDYPWVGAGFELGGVQVEASRRWYTGGISLLRLPGFARASFEAASQVLLLGLVLVFLVRDRLFKGIIWLGTGLCIALTTSKTPMAIWIAFSLLFCLAFFVSLKEIAPWLVLTLGVLVICLPFWTVLGEWRSYFVGSDPLLTLVVGSFGERFNRVWPDSLRIVLESGSPLLGRGLGGIGVAQERFELELFSPGDNMAVYLFSVWGVVGLVILVFYVYSVFVIKRMPGARIILSLMLAVLMEGITVNVLESAFFSYVFGVTCGVALSGVYRISRRREHEVGLHRRAVDKSNAATAVSVDVQSVARNRRLSWASSPSS